MKHDAKVLRAAQQRVVEALARHTAYLHRAATAQANDINEAVTTLGDQLAGLISERLEGLAPAELQAFAQGRYHTDRLKGLKKAIDQWGDELETRIYQLTLPGFEELAGHESEYARELLVNSLEDADLPPAPTAAASYSAAKSAPVMGQLLDEMVAEIPQRTRRQVYSAIRQGVAEGQTSQQIVRALRGTRALKYKDGVLQTTRNDAERMVRTGRNHISNVSYEETYRSLGVDELVWTSTLDGRTCLVAGSLVDTPEGPRPIEEISEGDMVIGGSGAHKKVSGTLKSSTRRLCRVRLSTGETVTCTPDHMFWTAKGWVEAQDLLAGISLPDRL